MLLLKLLMAKILNEDVFEVHLILFRGSVGFNSTVDNKITG